MWLGMVSAAASQVPGLPLAPLNGLDALLLAYIAQVAAWCAAPGWAELHVHLGLGGLIASYAGARSRRSRPCARARPRAARLRRGLAASARGAFCSTAGRRKRARRLRRRAAGRRPRRVLAALALLAPNPFATGVGVAAAARGTAGRRARRRPGRRDPAATRRGAGGAGRRRPARRRARGASSRALGVERLGAAVITHDQSDHAAGVEELLGRVPIARLVFARLGRRRWRVRAAAGAAPLRVAAGAVLRSGRLRLRVLWPPPELLGRPLGGADPNTQALVMLARWNGFAMLLTADAEAEAVPLDPGPVDVLKVAHHGSDDAGLAALLARSRPRLAVISVGAGQPLRASDGGDAGDARRARGAGAAHRPRRHRRDRGATGQDRGRLGLTTGSGVSTNGRIESGVIPAAAYGFRGGAPMAVMVAPMLRKLSARLPSWAGRRLPERIRSTTFAMLGITTAAGLGLVVLFSQPGWPLRSLGPLAEPSTREAVHSSVALAPRTPQRHAAAHGGGATPARGGGSHGGGTQAGRVELPTGSVGPAAASGSRSPEGSSARAGRRRHAARPRSRRPRSGPAPAPAPSSPATPAPAAPPAAPATSATPTSAERPPPRAADRPPPRPARTRHPSSGSGSGWGSGWGHSHSHDTAARPGTAARLRATGPRRGTAARLVTGRPVVPPRRLRLRLAAPSPAPPLASGAARRPRRRPRAPRRRPAVARRAPGTAATAATTAAGVTRRLGRRRPRALGLALRSADSGACPGRHLDSAAWPTGCEPST